MLLLLALLLLALFLLFLTFSDQTQFLVQLLILILFSPQLLLDFLRLLVLRADLTLELLDLLFELFVVLSGHGDFVLVLIFNRFQA